MSDPTSHVILQGVTKAYHANGQQVVALNHIDLTLKPGEFVCLAGPSGSGKSTLLHLVAALDQPTSGSIRVANQEISGLDRTAAALFRRATIGFVFQTFNLIPVLSAFENVEYLLLLQDVAAEERRERVTTMLAAVGLAELADRRVTELSGGQQQRVAVARALVGDPQVLLADEPTGNLDSANGEAIIRLLRHMNAERGTTVLYSSHDPRIIAWADRVTELADGRITNDRLQARHS